MAPPSARTTEKRHIRMPFCAFKVWEAMLRCAESADGDAVRSRRQASVDVDNNSSFRM